MDALRIVCVFPAQLAVDGSSDPEVVAAHFPFTAYFASAPQPLFRKASFEEDWKAAEGCFRHLQTMFKVVGGHPTTPLPLVPTLR
jgi:hypothetical protein